MYNSYAVQSGWYLYINYVRYTGRIKKSEFFFLIQLLRTGTRAYGRPLLEGRQQMIPIVRRGESWKILNYKIITFFSAKWNALPGNAGMRIIFEVECQNIPEKGANIANVRAFSDTMLSFQWGCLPTRGPWPETSKPGCPYWSGDIPDLWPLTRT